MNSPVRHLLNGSNMNRPRSPLSASEVSSSTDPIFPWEPTLKVDAKLRSFLDPDREDHEMVSQIFRACQQTDTDHFTSSGVYGVNDPRTADADEGKVWFEDKVNFMVEFIKEWKTIPVPPAFE